MATQNIFDLTDTWNNVATTFTAIKMNATDTASAAGSMLIDLQVGGASQFKVTKAGAATITTIELGHATDTTLSRVSAGVVAIEGVEVTTNAATQTLTNKTLSSPTLSGTVAGTPTYSGTATFTAAGMTLQNDQASFIIKEGGGTGRWIHGLRSDVSGNDSDYIFFNSGLGSTDITITAATGVTAFRVAPTANGVAVATSQGSKVTAAAPYTNDGYVIINVNGNAYKFMTTA